MALLGLPDDPAKQRLVLIGLVPLVGLAAYWYFLHGGYQQELTAAETRLETLEIRNAQARARAPESQQLEERLEVYERHIERLEELVPKREEVSQLLNTISERADQIGVSIIQFTPGGTDRLPHYNRRTFQMTVSGGYHDIGRFLSEIGSLPRIITPISLRLLPSTGQDATEELVASFLIETYVLREPGDTVPAGVVTGG
jgi:type IV pilus assembly protein PilO